MDVCVFRLEISTIQVPCRVTFFVLDVSELQTFLSCQERKEENVEFDSLVPAKF